jgi:hypothetical protein
MAFAPSASSMGGGGSAPQILTAQEARGRNTNSIMANWIDRGPWVYWDTITVLSGAVMASNYSPFSVAIGQQDPLTNSTKNKLQTNMVQGNSFPPPVCLLLGAIGIYFESNMLKADIDLILQNYYMEFRIDNKIFHEGYLWNFPQGGGLAGLSDNTGESVYTNGIPAPGYQRRYGDWSKYIAPLQRFQMNLIYQPSQILTSALGTQTSAPPTLTNGGTIRLTLDGFTDRSVQ